MLASALFFPQPLSIPAGAVQGLQTYRTHQASWRLFNFRTNRMALTGVSQMQVKLNFSQRATQPGAALQARFEQLPPRADS